MSDITRYECMHVSWVYFITFLLIIKQHNHQATLHFTRPLNNWSFKHTCIIATHWTLIAFNWGCRRFYKRPCIEYMVSHLFSSDIIDGLVDGRLGRNVGGLKHMVVTPATPDSTGKGRVNGAFQREDSTLSNLSSKLVWQYVLAILLTDSVTQFCFVNTVAYV